MLNRLYLKWFNFQLVGWVQLCGDLPRSKLVESLCFERLEKRSGWVETGGWVSLGKRLHCFSAMKYAEDWHGLFSLG